MTPVSGSGGTWLMLTATFSQSEWLRSRWGGRREEEQGVGRSAASGEQRQLGGTSQGPRQAQQASPCSVAAARPSPQGGGHIGLLDLDLEARHCDGHIHGGALQPSTGSGAGGGQSVSTRGHEWHKQEPSSGEQRRALMAAAAAAPLATPPAPLPGHRRRLAHRGRAVGDVAVGAKSSGARRQHAHAVDKDARRGAHQLHRHGGGAPLEGDQPQSGGALLGGGWVGRGGRRSRGGGHRRGWVAKCVLSARLRAGGTGCPARPAAGLARASQPASAAQQPARPLQQGQRSPRTRFGWMYVPVSE